MIGLVNGVDPVTTGAGADFAGGEGEPVALAHNAGVIGVGELPGKCAPRRNERGHRTVRTELHAGHWSTRWRRIVHCRVVEMLGNHTPPSARGVRISVVQAAQLIGLEDL